MLDREEILRLATQTFERPLQEIDGKNLVIYITQQNILSLPGAQALLEEFKKIFERLKPLNATVLDIIRIKKLAETHRRPIGTVISRIKALNKAAKELNPGLSLIITVIEERPHDRIVYQVGFIQSKLRHASA